MAQGAYTHATAGSEAKTVGSDFSEKASELSGKATRQIDKAVESAEAAVRNLQAQGGEAGERVQEVAGNIKGAIDKSLRDQPMTTLVVAAAFGFVLGALWKS